MEILAFLVCLTIAGTVCSAPRAIADAITTARASKAGQWDFLDKDRDRRDAKSQRWAQRWGKAWDATRTRRHKQAGGDGNYRPGLKAYGGDVYHGWVEDLIAKRQAKRAARQPFAYDPDAPKWHERVDEAVFAAGRQIRQRWERRGNQRAVRPGEESVTLAELFPEPQGPWEHAVPVQPPGGHDEPEWLTPDPDELNGDIGVVHDSNWYKIPRNHCWDCNRCGAVGLDYPTKEAAAEAASEHYCDPTRPADEARERLHRALADDRAAEPRCWCGALAVDGPYCPTHDYRTPPQDRALYDGQPYTDLTGVPDDAGYRRCDRCGSPMLPVAGTQHFDADGGAMVSTRCAGCGDIQSGHSWDWTDKPPAEDPDDPDHQDDDQITEPTSNQGDTMSSTTATGDVHDVESCDAQLDALDDDLDGIANTLDALDTAVGDITKAAELISAWLAAKDIDAAFGGMATVQDMLGADRLKELLDAVAAAKHGVEATRDAMGPLREARDLVGSAAGSAVNGR